MAGGECHMMIGLCELNWGGCHEGESSEPMPALTLGQGVEQNFQRLPLHSRLVRRGRGREKRGERDRDQDQDQDQD